MNQILSVVLSSMHADLARVDRVAMNLANAQTPGYKREVVAPQPFSVQVDAANARLVHQPRPPETSHSVHTDHRAGTLKPTGRSLDLAIVGDGWFEVATPQGPAFTRQGNFRVDAQGRLVTQQGHPVLGSEGEIQLIHGTPVVDSVGRVFEGDAAGDASAKLATRAVAHLRIVQFDHAAPMQRLGDGLVVLMGEPALAPEGAVEVRQGTLENSNVSHMQEMVRMLEAVRHLESMQKVAMGYDEMLASSIRRLGEP